MLGNVGLTLTTAEEAAMAGKYVHLPFNHQICPDPFCLVEGSVPGIKRHVKFIHGPGTYAKFASNGEFAPLRTPKDLEGVPYENLLAAAMNRKLVKVDKDTDQDDLPTTAHLIKVLTA